MVKERNREVNSTLVLGPVDYEFMDNRNNNFDTSEFATSFGTYKQDQLYECFQCEYRSNTRLCLQEHLLTHCQKPFNCFKCNFRSKDKDDLLMHLHHHLKKKPFSCLLCNFYSGRKSCLLYTHLIKHLKLFKCHLCVYRCCDNGELQRHLSTHSQKVIVVSI